MTFIRGSNPVWFEVDLTAHAFDDTFYLFILENEIPYIPETVWQDPFGNVVWDNPIQFLANGTLPNNIYFDAGVVYRLEFRQGNTQSDPLIYLVENYVPGTDGSTPVDEVAFSTDNQITNPQFALINFVSPTLSLSSISTQVIQVAPGWFLNLTGSGNVILTQVPINSTIVDPSNASWALQIQLTGSWTKAYLSQRFIQNGVLWANTFVSSSIMAMADLTSISPQQISTSLVDSQGNVTPLLASTSLTGTFNNYPDVVQLGNSIDTQLPPAAYIEYQLTLPNTCNLTISSIQLISSDTEVEFPYEQTTINRQIDHTYNTAYPIVPIGTVIDFYGFGTPAHYLPCNNAAVSRITYQLLFNTLTHLETVTLTMGSPTITVANGAIYIHLAPVEGTGIPGGTTIISISGNTITLSANATANGSQSLRFFAVGNGDGSTTFNTPSLAGCVIAGTGGTLFTSPLTNGVGQIGGLSTATLVAANIPQHTHNTTILEVASTGVSFGIASGTLNTGSQTYISDGGSSLASVPLTTPPTAFSIIQPTALAQKMIRYE